MPAGDPPLSARQRQVLAAVRELSDRRGYPPTLREIGDAVGLSSASSVLAHVRSLEGRGHLARTPQRPRALVVRRGDAGPRGQA